VGCQVSVASLVIWHITTRLVKDISWEFRVAVLYKVGSVKKKITV